MIRTDALGGDGPRDQAASRRWLFTAGAIDPPWSVKQIGGLAWLVSPRALTHRALSQTVAPLATSLGKVSCVRVRLAKP
jgi:hypothetical protein